MFPVTCCSQVNVDFDKSSAFAPFFKGSYSVSNDLTPAGSPWKVYKKGTGSNAETPCMWLMESIKTWAIGFCDSVGSTIAYVAFLYLLLLNEISRNAFQTSATPGKCPHNGLQWQYWNNKKLTLEPSMKSVCSSSKFLKCSTLIYVAFDRMHL